ncbi:neprilysin-2 isoform X2 [Eurytemora carolleeae]|uniref:neprilysin-2 isoform X2 n=1 Tax=Eurytemora carolleeae TaxID=1294199 RepID=UPI000C75FC6C|nr:neprilysin-2 isoform X2 [Eurytemora carolleeae]|eukprot:XP_023343135.1 neprilysin-2-like isoform X2 [Eurytemora affinis]
MNSFYSLILVTAMALGTRSDNERVYGGNTEKTCLTPGCVVAAADFIQRMDVKVDPCTDFYEFACGNYVKETAIPDHQTEAGTLNSLDEKLNKNLRKLFESSPGKNDPKIFKSVKNYYKSCMDQDNIEKTSKKAIFKLVDKLGGWPVLGGDTWNQKKLSWDCLDVEVIKLGLTLDAGNIMQFSIHTNQADSTKRIIVVGQPEFGLDREYLIKGMEKKEVQAYFRYMVDLAVYLGAHKETAEKELKESLRFEIKLSEMSLSQEERRNLTALNNEMTVEEANKLFPGLNWKKHINKIFRNLEIQVKATEIINIAELPYIKKLADYMAAVPARVQANYQIWRIIQNLVPFCDKSMQQIKLKFSTVLTGKEVVSPRWETCVLEVAGLVFLGELLFLREGSLTNAVGAMYAKEYFPESAKKVADDMVKKIKKEFKIILDELDWMDDITREKAHDKVDKMQAVIGYAKEILDPELLNQYYEGLELLSPNFITNNLKLKRFIKKYIVKELRKPNDPKSWKIHGGAAIVNAKYDTNTITLPAGILAGRLFQENQPKYMNYGGIGQLVGHELTHGYDDKGSQTDSNGNLIDWWEPETKQKFLEKAKCFIDQYGSMSAEINGSLVKLNGIISQGENIGDNGGIKQSYRAYERLIEEEGEELPLPGLPYTPRQLFWLSGASTWCSVYRDDWMKTVLLTHVHPPGRYRVNGSFRNQKEFSKDWNCPKGSPMNPSKKCQLW